MFFAFFKTKNFLKLNLIFFPVLFFVLKFNVGFINASELPYKFRGFMLIQTEDNGKAWYVDKKNGLRHYISVDEKSISTISRLSLGISNENLAKIPIAIDPRFISKDSDNDGVDDRIEEAIKINTFNFDSDGDGYNDSIEIKNNFNPLGPNKLPIDLNFSSKLASNILLQVEGSGELWYVNPKDGFRYYVGGYKDILKIIEYLGEGISNKNINQIVDASLINDKMIKNIKVDVSSEQKLYYYFDNIQIGSFPVSSGKYSTPTPKGSFRIINKHPKAWSYFGLWMPYWMGMGNGSFGFHELPIWPSGYREGENHLGVPVSHGCIRLGIGPAQFLYNWAEIGTPVIIY